MQHSKVRERICAANLYDVVLWEYYYSAAQKAITQRPRIISALEICDSRSLHFCASRSLHLCANRGIYRKGARNRLF